MSTIEITTMPPDPHQGPNCAECAGPTRLIGVEPHPVKPHTDLRTFQCLSCDHVQARVVPFAN